MYLYEDVDYEYLPQLGFALRLERLNGSSVLSGR